jgi:outer membrane receptor protein involved in Fe transport
MNKIISYRDFLNSYAKVLFILMPLFLFGGTVGKISGRITDVETNEALCGVDVFISAFEIGGATDEDGYFFILNVPPGKYDVESSMIGYRSEIKKGVEVFVDRSTYLNYKLKPTIIEIEEPIIVIAKRPVIEIDMTSKETRITRRELDVMPVEKPIEVIALQGGVTTDAAGNLHVRGGRTGELAYYIDGIEVSNPLLGNAPSLNKNLISEMSFLSGTFNAEYGNVMSGVVNIITPEGGRKLSTHLEYTSLMINNSPYRKKDWINDLDTTWYDAHRDTSGNSMYKDQDLLAFRGLPFLGEVNASVEGSIPFDQNTRFFIGGNYLNQESYMPFGYELSRSANAKLTRKFGPNFKLFINGQYVDNETQHYNHVYKYLYYGYEEEGVQYLVHYAKSLRAIIGLNHAPTNSFFYNVRFGYVVDSIKTEVPGLSEDTIIEPVRDNYSEFYISGYPIFRQEAITKKYIFKADFNLQVGKMHSFKFGIVNNFYNFKHTRRQQLFARGPIVYQDYEREPIDGALFLQDKIEHRYLVINAGLRFDYNYPNAMMWEDIEDPLSETSEVELQYQLSPRLGLSHPITDNAMLHFAYGHFFQTPAYEIMYFNSNYIAYPESIPRYGLVGNPRILPQRTTAYEVGVKYAIKEIYGIDITLFLKDIRDLLATTEVRKFPYDYIIYTNQDFGSVKGIDFTLKRELVSGFGLTINYTYQVARGNRSFAMQGFYDVYTGMPERMKEYYLDFDRRHTFSSNLEILTGKLGGVNVNFRAASGLPYTPYISVGVVVEENSGRKDWEYSLDIMIHQGIRLGKTTVDFFVKGINITDHLNPRYVYSRTGKPWDSGEEAGGLMGSRDYIIDPSHVGPRRIIKAGLRVTI